MDSAPASKAPRLAASMIPGPPPVMITSLDCEPSLLRLLPTSPRTRGRPHNSGSSPYLLGYCELADQDGGVIGLFFDGLAQSVDVSPRRNGFRNSRTAKRHDGIANSMLLEQSLRLEIFDLEAYAAPRRPPGESDPARAGHSLGFYNGSYARRRLGVLVRRTSAGDTAAAAGACRGAAAVKSQPSRMRPFGLSPSRGQSRSLSPL